MVLDFSATVNNAAVRPPCPGLLSLPASTSASVLTLPPLFRALACLQPTPLRKAKFVSAPPAGAIAHPGRKSQQQQQQQQRQQRSGPKIIRLRQGPKPLAVPSLNDFAVRPL